MTGFKPSLLFPAGLTLLACAGSGGSTVASSPATHSAAPAAATDSTDPAPPSPNTATQLERSSGASVFAIHQVTDFDAFIKFFAEGASTRAEQGIEGQLVSRLDDGRVIIHFFAKNLEQVEAALKSQDMDRYLAREGAPDASLVWLARDELVVVPETPPTGETFSLYMKFPVTDFEAFKRGFEERLPAFSKQHVIGEGLHRSSADESVAILHFMGTDRAALEALPNQPAFLELLSIAGTESTPTPLFATDVSRSRPQ